MTIQELIVLSESKLTSLTARTLANQRAADT